MSPQRIAAVRFSAVCSVLLALCLFTLQHQAQARLSSATDLGAVYESESAEIDVDDRGHSRLVVQRLIRIVNDEGRERESIQSIDFNDRASKLKVLDAYTINGKKITKVKAKNIEIKPVGDFSRFFDTQMKAKVSFPDVQVGSKLFLKYRLDTFEVPNEGFYSFLADFNWWYTEKYCAVIRSKLPLHVWKNDRENLLKFTPGKKGVLHTLSIESRAPIRLHTVQEENAFIRSERSLTFVVSTLASWNDYAHKTMRAQEKLFSARLPSGMERIRAAAVDLKSPVEQLDFVASRLSQDYRYFGDWRRRNGGFVSRSLREIDETRYGDCKDLSLATAAILRALGYRADLAWTLRGEPNLRPMRDWYSLPVDWFNHAIVRAEDREGKVYWIDPTNPYTYARSIPHDLAGRPAFVLRSNAGFVDWIPELTSESFLSEKNLVYKFEPESILKVDGVVRNRGRAAIFLTVNGFYKPSELVDFDLVHSIAYGFKVLDYKVGEYPRGSRVVTDKEIPMSFRLADASSRTSAGLGFTFARASGVDRLLENLRDRASDLYIDTPGVWLSREELSGVRRVGAMGLDCDLKNEWVSARRKVSETPMGIVADDRFEVVKSIVPNEALRTTEFEKFQARLRECFYRAVVVFEPR